MVYTIKQILKNNWYEYIKNHNVTLKQKKEIEKTINCSKNSYNSRTCSSCKFQKECAGSKKGHPYREAKINHLIRKIRLSFKTKKGVEKYNKRFHKGEVAQAHIFHNLGYREFKMRSKKSCENEVNLFSAAYNLKKIHNKLKNKRLFLRMTLLDTSCPFLFRENSLFLPFWKLCSRV